MCKIFFPFRNRTMFRLKAFVDERLSAAAGEIFREFEKTIALYKAELSRSKEEVDNLRKQLELQCEKSAAEPPSANRTVIGEGCDSTLVQENLLPLTPVERGEGCNLSPRPEVPGPSQTNAGTENTNLTCCTFKTDSEISPIKEEQEELGIDSQIQGAFFLSPDFVKSEQDQVETEVTPELEPLSSDCSTAQSENSDDEDWMESKGTRTRSKKRKAKAVQRQTDRTRQQRRDVLPHEDSSAKSQKDDRSFCHLCGKAFHYIGSLMKHIKTHDKTVNCGVCRITFQSTEELIRHLQSTHNKTHFCDVCGKTFAKISLLRVHLKIHTGLKQFSCQDCGKGFLRKSELIVHARTHSGEKPYCCEICGKAFNQRPNLVTHKRSHTGEKPYHCNVCGKNFSTSSHLKTHMRYHSGEKPYSCDICGRHFRQSGQLTSHKRIHTGERPYGCHLCGVRYRFGANLKMHMKVHDKESTVAASTCME